MGLEEQRHLSPGVLLDQRYRIVSHLKAGGMGAVYRAEDLKLGGKVCAIKEMIDSFESASDRQAGIDRFLSEVHVMESMAHANIPRVTDHFMENNNFYFVMEFIEGTDLSRLLEREGSPGLNPTQVLEWAVQICRALEYIHSLKPPVVHRDLKPSNLLLRHSDGRILLVDFGIARVTIPQPGFWIGTAGYAPFEQQMQLHEPRSDLYAVGVCIHELISGKKPDESYYFPSFEELGIKGVPAGVWGVLENALQQFPNDRYGSARRMREAVQQVLGYEPAQAHDAAFAFMEAVGRLKEAYVDPLLHQLMNRYGNECQTPFLPRQLERLVFTLGASTPFKLIIQANEPNGTVDFLERQGILDEVYLGAVRPGDEEAGAQVRALIERFVQDYESFKNASWQLML